MSYIDKSNSNKLPFCEVSYTLPAGTTGGKYGAKVPLMSTVPLKYPGR